MLCVIAFFLFFFLQATRFALFTIREYALRDSFFLIFFFTGNTLRSFYESMLCVIAGAARAGLALTPLPDALEV
jgi:hypothetical protein